jgi:uncharacterized protein (DUF58 family)
MRFSRPWKRRRAEGERSQTAAEIARAARVLWVRSRRAVASPFAGGYRSAFRGGGVEFEESRPYVPGDDVATLDWNATARTGEPYVKRFREERDQTVLLLLDVSASMRFGSVGRTKAGVAAHAAALIAAAAGHAGDRIGLLTFDTRVRREIRPGRGDVHTTRIVHAAVEAASESGGGTDLAELVARVRILAPRRSVLILLSDLRDVAARPLAPALRELARRHELVAALVHDPREEEIPAAGPLRLVDPEHPGRSALLDAGSARVRERYRDACRARDRGLERSLRGAGIDVLWLRTDRDPLRALLRFFPTHAGRVGVAS